jgi:hypothetical protein
LKDFILVTNLPKARGQRYHGISRFIWIFMLARQADQPHFPETMVVQVVFKQTCFYLRNVLVTTFQIWKLGFHQHCWGGAAKPRCAFGFTGGRDQQSVNSGRAWLPGSRFVSSGFQAQVPRHQRLWKVQISGTKWCLEIIT